jgi:hypothetical protein
VSEIETGQINSDVSPASSEPAAPAPEQNQDAAQAAPQTNNEDSQHVPFDKHPRFKELIEQKNQFAQQAREMQAAYRQMQQKLESLEKRGAPQGEKDALLERLKQIDPEFGGRFEQMNSALEELKALKEWKEQFETSQTQTQAHTQLKSLYEQHKVPEEVRDMYKAAIADLAQRIEAERQAPLGLRDLPQVFQQVHERFSKYVDGIKRSERESYVQTKKADVATPTPKRGATASPESGTAPKSRAEAHQSKVNEILKLARQDRDPLS